MDEPRHALEAERQIPGYNVYELDGRWRAVHKRDRSLILEHHDWRELAWSCVGARISADLREAAEELAIRMAEPGREWRTNGPGSGINV
ncbi:hypothetical protein ACQPZP_14525 [Spirillospora sp. CA-142024]|uniref:hypothetical protein n=1 Tax=Spirillospora sp. CA-142024 TaxID=3240036 RepID=UPI003D8ACB83